MTRRNKKQKENAQEKIVKKYGMSPEKVASHDKRVAETKAKYSMDIAEVERALTEYLEIKDPIVVGGKAIVWVKRPSMKQLKALIPEEMRPYAKNPTEAPDELKQKYEKFFYEKMAEIVVIPKRTASEWEEWANPWFVRLFWNHIANIAQVIEGPIEGF